MGIENGRVLGTESVRVRAGRGRLDAVADYMRQCRLDHLSGMVRLQPGTFPKRRIRRGITRISHVLCDKAKRGCASRVPPSPGATARRTRGVLVEGATPLF